MSRLAALFFARLERADFYRALHAAAVAGLSEGQGRTWLDVGCGPGLLVRLAARRGWRARGIDRDPAMIDRARRLGGSGDLAFAVGALDDLEPGSAAVVSAASLLVGLPDRRAAVAALAAALEPGGVLLVVETTAAMRPVAAWRRVRRGDLGGGGWMLALWAWARRRARPVDAGDFALPGFAVERTDLLDGLVAAWALRRTQSVATATTVERW